MKHLVVGQIFESGTGEDIRTYKFINPYIVELIKPSGYQVKMDIAFRNGDWKKNAVNKIEPEWYRQRGFFMMKSITKETV